MKHLAWMFAGISVLAGLASPCAAQLGLPRPTLPVFGDIVPTSHITPIRSRFCPTIPTVPGMPGTPGTLDPSSPTTPPGTVPDFSGAGEFKGSTGRTSSVVAGSGLGGAVTGDPFVTTIVTPLVIPGLFTSTGLQSAIPIDRVSFESGYFNRIAVKGVGSSAPVLVRTPVTTNTGTQTKPILQTVIHSTITQSSARVAGFNLHTFNLGVEKTCFDGMASIYVSVPFLLATENVTGQAINGIGDINLGFKVILYQTLPTGNTLTGGFTVSIPTAHAASSTSYMQTGNGEGDQILPASTITTNPTFLQPWLASLLVFDRAYIHQYLSVVAPTDSRVATFLNYDITLGYLLYRANERRLLSSLTPTLGVHALIPMNHRGITTGQAVVTEVPFENGQLPAPPAPSGFAFSDQVFTSGGLQIGLHERWLFSANVVVPVVWPGGYNIGATFGLNYYY